MELVLEVGLLDVMLLKHGFQLMSTLIYTLHIMCVTYIVWHELCFGWGGHLLSIHAVFAGSDTHLVKASSSLIMGYSSVNTLKAERGKRYENNNTICTNTVNHIKNPQQYYKCTIPMMDFSTSHQRSTIRNIIYYTHLSPEVFPVPTTVTAKTMNWRKSLKWLRWVFITARGKVCW